MVKTKYKVIEPKAPHRDLIRVSGERSLTAGVNAFGPNCFSANIKEMQKQYLHPQTGAAISFREPTTAESILVASYDFANRAKPEIFDSDSRWLQAGWIVRTSEGVFANPPRENGEIVTDEQKLKSLLNGTKPVSVGNGNIYIVPNTQNLRDFGFAEYPSLVSGFQSGEDFANSGLARLLEHTENPTENLKNIASKKNYPDGVSVTIYFPINTPSLTVAGLSSGMHYMYSGRLLVGIDGMYDCYDQGCAFGVLD